MPQAAALPRFALRSFLDRSDSDKKDKGLCWLLLSTSADLLTGLTDAGSSSAQEPAIAQRSGYAKADKTIK